MILYSVWQFFVSLHIIANNKKYPHKKILLRLQTNVSNFKTDQRVLENFGFN